MSSRRLRLAVLTAAALCALGAALVVAFATTGSSSNARPISKFAAGDPDNAAAKFGNGNEASRSGISPEDWAATMEAYPAREISPQWTQNAENTFNRLASRTPKAPPNPGLIGVWQNAGPQGRALEPGILNFTGAPYNTASRTASIAIDPACGTNACRMWVGPVGGGIWRTENALAAAPSWTYLSSPFAQNSIGEIVLSPSAFNRLYVGTGEPNSCSSGCAAGVGIYRSDDGGDSWVKLADSCVSNATYTCVTPGTDAFLGRGISEIVVDPANSSHLLVGSATAARSISHIIGLGGQVRFNEPGANTPGLYESLDGGATFQPVWLPNINTGVPGAGRRGVIDVGIDVNNGDVVYASSFDKGVYRRCPSAVAACGGEAYAAGPFSTDFKQVFAPRAPGTDVERTMFDMTVTPAGGPNAGKTRMYLTTGKNGGSPGGSESPSSFWRNDNVNQTSAALLASEPAAGATPPAGNGNPYPATYSNWQILTSSSTASPYWATHNFCTGQCWYDQDVYTPKNPANPLNPVGRRADEVYVLGSFQYGELPCDTRGVGCGTGISNGRAVLWSTTAGDPDPANSNRTFTDETIDARNQEADYCAYAGFVPCLFAWHSIHPDQHEIVVVPSNPNRFIEGSDGGLNRTDGGFETRGSSLCSIRGLAGSSFTQCTRLLSRMPTAIESINNNFGNTIQFVGVAANPRIPCQIIGGTQDNGTWTNGPNCDSQEFKQVIYGDGGNAGFDANPDKSAVYNSGTCRGPGNAPTCESWMFNEFTSPATDSNFRSGAPDKWVVTYTPLLAEPVGFYWPQIADPNSPVIGASQTHAVFSALRHVWRSWAFGAGHIPASPNTTPQDTEPDIAYYEANCPEFLVGGEPGCGDWQQLGAPGLNSTGDLTGTAYTGRGGGGISWVSRRRADTNTMWATTSGGRVFLTRDANNSIPSAVSWFRVDNLAQPANPCPANPDAPNCSPTRHPNGIYPDPYDANVAYISYSGYNATTPSTPGHVFKVTVTPATGTPTGVTFQNLNIESGTSIFPTPTSTGDLPVNDVVGDDPVITVNGTTGAAQIKLYAATDFGVLQGVANAAGAYTWTVTSGMPRFEVSHLAMVPGQRDACRSCPGRILYAATHSQGIWLNRTG